MKSARNIFALLLVMLSIFGYTQDKRANKLYKSGDYKGALTSYLKSYEKEPNDYQLAEKIGLCYLELQDYLIASEYFKEASLKDPSNNTYKMEYVRALIYALEIDRAEAQLDTFLLTNPGSQEAIRLKETCSHIKSWEEIKDEFIVIPLINLNSAYDEYGPAVYNDNLVFTSNRYQDLKDFQGVGSQKDRLTNIYIAEFDNNEKTRFEKATRFLPNLDESNNHGPLSFTKFGKSAFFNSTGINAQKIGKKLTMKVFEIENISGEWSKPKGISINNNSYSIYHPFITEDGNTLFYVSDRPGGIGGLDIYYSTKESGVWGTPKNMGSKINTAADEAFPTYFDGTLYFSSNGLIGYGGMDIYEVDDFQKPNQVKNMGYPINSSSDDFQLTYRSKEEGYFVSDRPGGKGGDDLFAFKKQELDVERTSVRGVISFNDIPTQDARVDLIDQAENVLQTSVTDKNGRFQFNAVGVRSLYEIKVNLNGAGITDDIRFHLLNSKGEKVVAIFPDEKNRLIFEALPADEYNGLKPIDSNNSLLSIDLKGQIYKEKKGDISERVTLYVLNPENQVMARGFTDSEGNFEFKRLPPEDYYTLRPDHPIPGIKIVMMEEGDEIVFLSQKDKSDDFLYTRLSPDDDYITLMNEDGYPVNIKMNENFMIDNIYYAIDSFEINEAAKVELTKLAKIMLNNPTLVIALKSHTDSRDSDEYNRKLSQKRADAAKEYLVEKGVNPEHVKAIGMGETQLTNQCSNGIKCSEEEHAENRRTEFQIIKN